MKINRPDPTDIEGLLAFHRSVFGDARMDAEATAEAFALPEDLTALSAAELDALESDANARFDTLYAEHGSAPNSAQLAELTGYRDAIVAVRTERGVRVEAAAELNASMAELNAPEVEAETPAEAVVAEAEAVVEAAAVTPAETSPAETPALVAAAPRRPAAPRIGELARRSPRPAETAAPASRASLVAAADTGYAAGTVLSFSQLGEAAERRYGALPKSGTGAQRLGIGMVRKPELPAELVASGGDDDDVLDFAASESRLSGGSLVAAGGWCAPSETWYDLAPGLESGEGLIALPTVGAPRGGVKFTEGPQFCDFYSGTGFFTQTEAQAEAQTAKPTFEIGCPNFAEKRLEAHGLSLQAGILQQKGYPEYVARFIAGSLVAHAHRINALKIQAMVAEATNVVVTGGTGAINDVLGAVELQVEDMRYKFRTPVNATMEAVLPLWLRGVLRSDLARRNGVPFAQVSNAQLNAHLTERGIAAQWVYDWQDAMCMTLDAGADASVVVGKETEPAVGTMGHDTPLTAWPDEVDILIYPAGTYVALENDVITLDAVYSPELFKVNQYHALFTEEAIKVFRRAYQARNITVPLVVSGATGAQVAGTATTL